MEITLLILGGLHMPSLGSSTYWLTWRCNFTLGTIAWAMSCTAHGKKLDPNKERFSSAKA